MKVGVIGLGNMGRAMIGGMKKAGMLESCQVIGSDVSAGARQTAAEELGIRIAQDNVGVAEASELIVLAVKPQYYTEVIEGIRGLSFAGKTILSIAPGKTIQWIQEQFGFAVPVIRCMPNTPALVGEGCTGVCCSPQVDREVFARAKQILESFGQAVEVAEHLMDVVVGISGSAPAYVFMFIEAMADAAVAEGMPRQQAYEMAAQAVLGSARMVLETGRHPGELKDMVCSPAGTTIQAVRVLEEKNFRGTIIDAVIACIETSRQL